MQDNALSEKYQRWLSLEDYFSETFQTVHDDDIYSIEQYISVSILKILVEFQGHRSVEEMHI